MSKSKVLFFLKLFILFVLFPAAIFIGIFVFKEKGYPYVITAVTVFTLVIFFASFEKKKMIVNCLIKRIEVSRGYKLKVEFNIDFEQFMVGIDKVA